MLKITDLKFDQSGLIPAVVQDYYTKKVLTLAYMNAESLTVSISEKRTCFFSRSKNRLWRKGETSKNFQNIVSIKADCDRDALVVEVKKDGPACHLGTDSCFGDYLFVSDEIKEFSAQSLYGLIAARKAAPKEGSYTSYLFKKGLDKILKKIGEEATEVVIAAKSNDPKDTVCEISDLAYHIMTLMVFCGIKIDDVVDELSRRSVLDEGRPKEAKFKA
jgi:phosphoribosyl-ATP pyrophosphohydrolase/phosphoribosyl-AMP cyclohydrolase